MIEEAIKSRCGAFGGLTALIGQQVWPMLAPSQPTYPLVIYHLLGETQQSAMGKNVEIVRAHLQFNALAQDPNTAKAVARQVKAAWDRIGLQPTANGVTIQDSFPENLFDLPIESGATEAPIYGVAFECYIEYA